MNATSVVVNQTVGGQNYVKTVGVAKDGSITMPLVVTLVVTLDVADLALALDTYSAGSSAADDTTAPDGTPTAFDKTTPDGAPTADDMTAPDGAPMADDKTEPTADDKTPIDDGPATDDKTAADDQPTPADDTSADDEPTSDGAAFVVTYQPRHAKCAGTGGTTSLWEPIPLWCGTQIHLRALAADVRATTRLLGVVVTPTPSATHNLPSRGRTRTARPGGRPSDDGGSCRGSCRGSDAPLRDAPPPAMTATRVVVQAPPS
jgi:hypothetical protein